jgi:hypothetical protein
MERRPELLSSVMLRQNPHNVHEWHKRVKLFASNPTKQILTYTEAVKTVDADKVRAVRRGARSCGRACNACIHAGDGRRRLDGQVRARRVLCVASSPHAGCHLSLPSAFTTGMRRQLVGNGGPARGLALRA